MPFSEYFKKLMSAYGSFEHDGKTYVEGTLRIDFEANHLTLVVNGKDFYHWPMPGDMRNAGSIELSDVHIAVETKIFD